MESREGSGRLYIGAERLGIKLGMQDANARWSPSRIGGNQVEEYMRRMLLRLAYGGYGDDIVHRFLCYNTALYVNTEADRRNAKG